MGFWVKKTNTGKYLTWGPVVSVFKNCDWLSAEGKPKVRVTELGSFMVPIGLHHWLGFGGGHLRRMTPYPYQDLILGPS